MSLTGTWGVATETSEKSLVIPDIDWAAPRYGVVSKEKDTTVVTNLTAPLDQPETVRYSAQPIRNVYSNTGIDPAYSATSKRGISVLVQLNRVYRITDTANAAFRIDLPVSVHTVIRVPLHDMMTPDLVWESVKKQVSLMTDQGSVTSSRIAQLLRSGTTPSGL